MAYENCPIIVYKSRLKYKVYKNCPKCGTYEYGLVKCSNCGFSRMEQEESRKREQEELKIKKLELNRKKTAADENCPKCGTYKLVLNKCPECGFSRREQEELTRKKQKELKRMEQELNRKKQKPLNRVKKIKEENQVKKTRIKQMKTNVFA